MRVVIGLLVVSKPAQSFDHRILRFGLTGVDYVINFGDVAKVRMIRLALLRRNPTLVLVGIKKKLAISEILSQQAELPHVIRNVLAHVTDGAIRAHNYLLIFFSDSLCDFL